MDKALWKTFQRPDARAGTHGWSRKMSDHIAYALLIYTGLNIVLTVGAIKGALEGSILPYFSLVILVAAIIPACRSLEKRWERLELSSADLCSTFRRDRAMVWVAAIALPIVITALFTVITSLI